jgi:CRP-like cAMP-binding protein
MAEPVKHSLVRALEHVPVFAPLEQRLLLEVVGASANLCFPEGTTVFSAGDPAEALYVVLSGRVSILDGERALADIEPGDVFGEMALLAETTRRRSARAASDSELMVLPRESFLRLLERSPEIASEFRSTAERRRRAAEATDLA